jgi:carboxylate-amine ligase
MMGGARGKTVTREPGFTIGIEEEYLLVDKRSRDLGSAPGELFARCTADLGGQVSPEFLKCQMEVATGVCETLDEARQDLTHLRRTIARHADAFGLAPLACSAHPFANWQDQSFTEKERYEVLARDLADVARRMLICGMHVHVGIEDADLRIDLMSQLTYFLPHLLMLSTSSPFWQGKETGLNCYRLTVMDNLPRTGLPPRFHSHGEYQRSVDILCRAGEIEDATKIWWDLRPSDRFPTLETRICDVPTALEDTIAIAAIIRCLTRMLYRLRRQNMRWRIYDRFLVSENRWRAQRYGMDNGLIDFGRGEVVAFDDLFAELCALIADDVDWFGCQREIDHARTIVQRGTSADRQLAIFRTARQAGADERDALCHVVDWLARTTVP